MINLKHKYRAVKTKVDDITFASKKEAKRYHDLKLLKASGQVVFFLMQVPFRLPGGVKYLADFMIFWDDGSCTVEDVKGIDTPMSKLKRKQVEDIFNIKIDLV